MPILFNGKELVSSNSNILGEIKLLPFRINKLPKYWYFCNGDRYLLESDIGQVLNNLDSTYKMDFNITIQSISPNETINIPSMFYSDGRGYFIQSVNGSSRNVGSTQIDQMRPISGTLNNIVSYNSSTTGSFTMTQGGSFYEGYEVSGRYNTYHLNSTLQGTNYNGTDTHPINIGFVPCIFLGI